MNIGLLLPSLLATKRFSERIFAPKPLFAALADGLMSRGHTVICYAAEGIGTKAMIVSGNHALIDRDYPSVRVKRAGGETQELAYRATESEYEVELTVRAFHEARQQGMDILHSYHDFLAHYVSRLVPTLPVIYTLHDPPYDENTLEGWRLRHFPNDNYIAISDHQKQLYEKMGVTITGTVLHGLRMEEFPFVAESEPYLAFIGRLIREKGPIDAIDAAMKGNMRLEIATSENYLTTPYTQNEVKPRLESTNLVKMKGLLKEQERNNWLSKATALIFPIHWDEPFGLVMIEAMACGTPVITYNRGSVSEVVRDGLTGFIIDPDDEERPGKGSWIIKKQGVEGLIEAIGKIGGIDRLACRKHVEENFSVAKMVEGYEKVYQKVIESHTSQP